MLDIVVDTDTGKLAELLARLSGESKSSAESKRDANGRFLAGGSSITNIELLEIVAEAAAETTRGHLLELHAARHRGVTQRSFYLRAAEAVVADASKDGARVQIDHAGLALRFYGGRVYPSGRTSLITGKPIRRIAVPKEGSEAEGKTPYDFRGRVSLIITKRKKAFLGKEEADGSFTPLFWLVEMTKHEKDPTVLPTDDTLADAAEEAIDEYIQEVSNGR